jgi:hypothetical protein
MSEDNEFKKTSDNNNPLTEQFDDYVSTDVITDLKTGIYNLYLSLLNHLTVQHGPVEAVIISTEFLDNISSTFKQTIEKENN